MLPQFQDPAMAFHIRSVFYLLFLFSACYGFLLYYIVTNITMVTFNGDVKQKQKLMFSVFCGICVDTFFMYFVYMIDTIFNLHIFTHELYKNMIVMTNPLSVCVFYFLSVRVLRLSRSRALYFITLLYVCVLTCRMSRHFLNYFVFIQSAGAYNYTQDVLSIIFSHIVNIVIYFFIMLLLRKSRLIKELSENRESYLSVREIIRTAFLIVTSYLAAVIIPTILADNPIGYFLLTIVYALIFTVAIVLNAKLAATEKLMKKDAYIQSLTDANNNFKLVKHDFYNILSTYSGYIEIGDIEKLKIYHEKLLNTTVAAGDRLDLNKHMNENPSLVSLINIKIEHAVMIDVLMRVSIFCNIEMPYMDTQSLTRAVACLLDNALEAASESQVKRVSLLIEQAENGYKRILITNSTSSYVEIDKAVMVGYTTKAGHTGLGLKEARQIMEDSGCFFDLSQINNEFTVYIEIPPAVNDWAAQNPMARVTQ